MRRARLDASTGHQYSPVGKIEIFVINSIGRIGSDQTHLDRIG